MNYLYDEKVSKSTISRKLSSLRTFYNYLLDKEIIEMNYFSFIKNPKKDKRLPRFVSDNNVDKMLILTVRDLA